MFGFVPLTLGSLLGAAAVAAAAPGAASTPAPGSASTPAPVSTPPAALPFASAPVAIGEARYYCEESSLYVVGEADGVVRLRHPLPGFCREIASDGQRLEITVGGNDGTKGWQHRFSAAADLHDLPFMMPAEIAPIRASQRQANLFKGSASGRGETVASAPDTSTPERRAEVERLVAGLSERRRLDPTNPWYDFYLGEGLAALGEQTRAAEAYRAVLAHDERYDFELLPLASALDRVAPDLAAEAFARGLRFYVAHGFEPELCFGIGWVFGFLGKPARATAAATQEMPADAERDRAALTRFGERLLDVAPRAEAAAFFYNAMAEAAQKRGDAIAAARWRTAREHAAATVMFGPLPPVTRFMGSFMQAMLACLMAPLLLLVGKAGRRLEGEPTHLLRLNPMARWHGAEILGLALVLALAPLLGWYAARCVAFVGAAAGAPVALGSGSLAHPVVRTYLETATENDSVSFMRGLAAQQTGESARAAELYRKSSSLPESKVNLGVLLYTQGDTAGARRLWQEAYEAAPELAEASFDLAQSSAGDTALASRAAESPRVARARRLGLRQPMLALPSPAIWAQFWEGRLAATWHANALERVTGVLELLTTLQDDERGGGMIRFVTILGPCALILGVVALIMTRRRGIKKLPSRLDTILGYAVPGASARLGVAGPFIAALFVFVGTSALAHYSSGGIAADVVNAIAIPSYDRFYGIAEPFPDRVQLWLGAAAHGVWIVPLANAGLVWISSRRRARRRQTVQPVVPPVG